MVSWMILLGTGPRVRQDMIFAELSLDEQLLALLWKDKGFLPAIRIAVRTVRIRQIWSSASRRNVAGSL
jgi:hypothetical protein